MSKFYIEYGRELSTRINEGLRGRAFIRKFLEDLGTILDLEEESTLHIEENYSKSGNYYTVSIILKKSKITRKEISFRMTGFNGCCGASIFSLLGFAGIPDNKKGEVTKAVIDFLFNYLYVSSLLYIYTSKQEKLGEALREYPNYTMIPLGKNRNTYNRLYLIAFHRSINGDIGEVLTTAEAQLEL